MTVPAVRIERLYGGEPESAKDILERVSPELRNHSCPKCGAAMTLVKAKADTQWGETLTFQCHSAKASKMCLLVVTVTTAARYYMRPGDFDQGDIGWQDAAKDTIPEAEANKLLRKKEIKATKAFEGVKVKPEYPTGKNTAQKVIWDLFWLLYFDRGSVIINELESRVEGLRKDFGPKEKNLIDTIPEWITYRTGYAIVNRDGKYEITGRTVGGQGTNALPYSDPEYRAKHGFDN